MNTESSFSLEKPMLDTDGQIDHLIKKGLSFRYMSESDARVYLEQNNNYFRLRAYRKNFDKHPDGINKGKYIDLDFAMLVDLSVIDMRLRYVLLTLVLDVEHFSKVLLLKTMTETKEDGYQIVSDYFSALDETDKLCNTSRLSQLYHELDRSRNNPYCGGIIDKYNGQYPIWAFVEVIPMGSYIHFFEFCSNRLGNRALKDIVPLLKTVKDLRNAAAHSNCILYDMGAQDARYKSDYAMIQKLSSISKTTRSKKLGNERTRQITTLLYAHSRIVSSDGVHQRAAKDLREVAERMNRNLAYYRRNDLILTNFEFFRKVVDILFQ